MSFAFKIINDARGGGYEVKMEGCMCVFFFLVGLSIHFQSFLY